MTYTPDVLAQLLEHTVASGASDLHISTASTPRMRVNGELSEIGSEPIASEQIWSWLNQVLSERQKEAFESHGDVDFGFEASGGARFRVSLYRERGRETLAIRALNSIIPSMDDIALPPTPREWTAHQNGLVIVTGPTGSGKSTTIASMVNSVNLARPSHILTIEDPIEYVLPKAAATVRQREVGSDTDSFPRAVRAALREDADILVIGEMRDLETIAAAITVAETGHLVFATLHTSSAAQAIDRMIDAFHSDEQALIRSRLAACLVGVIYQRLLPASDGGRVAAFEVLVANYPIKNLIREGKTYQIPNMMQTGAGVGMQSMASALAVLENKGKITAQQVADFLDQNRD